ncbi:putative pre-mRNA-splicing factor ATP-dependent RNA helicase DHX32 isoform X2 [Trichosurus vulpecula]|uniref:putative pre-mRNA-splicing factor ATP-dependent RNA helicase DHX32 isoform X2 n=1 Tax=Trichosurus vulpecula TaxID=9337 RepID=UPI00186B2807|nr:putative pre-mRNA-splicing factor ATP-dependent RNA helicase DHX32 isoform X2 [Trichosurus vulpecula]
MIQGGDMDCCPGAPCEKRYFPDSLDSSDADDEGVLACEDLELNPFDGLPYSSRYYKLLKEREDLPVWKEKYPFMESLLQSQIVIVAGEAKCGKSSQVPQWCAEYCLSTRYQHGGVVCAQVHKQTAIQLALRVADEMDVILGHEVGYAIPFENCCTSETILRYCTDEILQREMMSVPFLGCYGVIILDDVHERSVSTDVLLGLLKDVLLARPELKLVILTSPPLVSKLNSYYGNVPHIEVRNSFPVEVVHLCAAPKDHLVSVIQLIFEIHHTGEKGDIAAFLACEQEIEKVHEIVCQESSNLNPDLGELIVAPLYPKERCLLFKPNEDTEKRSQVYQRKVVLTTSSGETLLRGSSVRFVIDVGLERRKVYRPRIRASSLVLQPISRSQADIRKQILGASSSGKLFRLYSEEFICRDMKPLKAPELQEANLTSLVLFLKRIDIAGLGHCDFLSRPAPESLMQALEDLDYLAALDNDGNLSEFGIIMSEFPLDPKLSKAILASCEFDCVDEMLTIAAMVTEEAWQRRMDLSHPEGDHLTLLNVYKAYQDTSENCVEKWCADHLLSSSALRMAESIREELLDIVRRIELPYTEPDFGSKENTLNIKKALVAGYFMQIARDVDGSGNYLMLTHKQVAQLHPLSCYYDMKKIPEWVVFHTFSISENNCIQIISEISPELFMQLAPPYYFSNLPPSESKDILQQVINHFSPISTMKKEQKTSKDKMCEECPEASAEPRCVIQ